MKVSDLSKILQEVDQDLSVYISIDYISEQAFKVEVLSKIDVPDFARDSRLIISNVSSYIQPKSTKLPGLVK